MAIVFLSRALAEHAGGVDRLEIDAPRVQELLIVLADRYPGLRDTLPQMAVAIDGEIYNDADYQPLRDGSEVHLVPRIAGG